MKAIENNAADGSTSMLALRLLIEDCTVDDLGIDRISMVGSSMQLLTLSWDFPLEPATSGSGIITLKMVSKQKGVRLRRRPDFTE